MVVQGAAGKDVNATPRRYAFRADASLEIGSGHVMRCLTLADALRARGGECHFICRPHAGHMIDVIRQRGHVAHPLSAPVVTTATGYAAWLGADWSADAQQSAALLRPLRPDWLIIDHYALDADWERAVAPACGRVMAIDDLADRHHACELLLDQNLGRHAADYRGLVPTTCTVLAGPGHALLRPDFAAERERSLLRRDQSAPLRRLLITMGGMDQADATGQALVTLRTASALPEDCRITVVMGASAPWLARVRALADAMPWPTEVVVNVRNMASLMADCDLCLGAAGGTAWERCCLGLPTIMLVTADNQRPGALALAEAGAVRLLGDIETGLPNLPQVMAELIPHVARLRISHAAASITDGRGAMLLAQRLDTSSP